MKQNKQSNKETVKAVVPKVVETKHPKQEAKEVDASGAIVSTSDVEETVINPKTFALEVKPKK